MEREYVEGVVASSVDGVDRGVSGGRLLILWYTSRVELVKDRTVAGRPLDLTVGPGQCCLNHMAVGLPNKCTRP